MRWRTTKQAILGSAFGLGLTLVVLEGVSNPGPLLVLLGMNSASIIVLVVCMFLISRPGTSTRVRALLLVMGLVSGVAVLLTLDRIMDIGETMALGAALMNASVIFNRL